MASKKERRSSLPSLQNPFGLEQDVSTEEQAEDTLVRVLEERRARANGTGGTNTTWSRSVAGEEPPLMPEVPSGLEGTTTTKRQHRRIRSDHLSGQSRPTLLDVGLRVRAMKMAGKWSHNTLTSNRNVIGVVAEQAETEERDEVNPMKETVEEDSHSEEGEEVTENIFEGVGGENPEVGYSHIAAAETDADRLISGAMAVDELFNDDASSLSTEFSGSYSTLATNEETLPLTEGGRRKRLFGWLPFVNYGAAGTGGRRHRRRRRKGWFIRFLKHKIRSNIWEALRPSIIKRGIKSFLFSSILVGVFPLLGIAALLFYEMGNPTPDFLEGLEASMSYWFVFVARQWLTLDLAKFTEFLLVDVLALRSKTAVKLIGPLTTLFAIQAKGWPLQAVLWSLWDLFILHGDNAFQQNWFFFTGIQLFSRANPGGDFIESHFYLRVLMAVLIAGLATAAKRTVMAMYFGKKTFLKYKARIEKLLVEILVVSEVAELSREMEGLDLESDEFEPVQPPSRGITKWQSMKFNNLSKKRVAFDDDYEDNNESDSSDLSDNDEQNTDSTSTNEEVLESDRRRRGFLHRRNSGEFSSGSTSKAIGIKALLDRWEEPVNKLDKAVDPSIHDILQFRKALTFMDERHPFSRSFGPASTRDECIRSAQSTYKRLNALAIEDSNLSFNVLSVLATDEDGLHDRQHMTKLRRVFRPDRYNELSELAFVQSCDAVYRKLRYFRASVGNSSVIDKVLGEGLDKVFFFFLALLMCAVMNYNPWTLLVSLSTLVVSFAFAVGPSASKYIEGLLLIAARSPYDLGDRILIVGSENVNNDGPLYSWFVEDINLYSTTLRFGATNEVATVSNGSIAGSRIVNCARSPNALITLTLKFMIYITDEEASVMKDAIQQYINDRPRMWVQIIFFRSDELDPDDEYIFYTLRVQHRKTWQDSTAILRDRAELHRFCYQTGEALGILFDSPMRRIRIYRPGEKEIRPSRHDTEEDGPANPAGEGKEFSLEDALAAAGLKT